MSRQGAGFLSAVFLIAAFTGVAASGAASAAVNQHYQRWAVAPSAAPARCVVLGAISHRCLNFHSDSTWPAGLADYHGSNGG